MPVKDLQPSNIRNIALCSPHGTGKTSLAESLLYRAKVTTRHGKVEEGTTALDFSPEEIHRKITVSLGVAPLEWRDTDSMPRMRATSSPSSMRSAPSRWISSGSRSEEWSLSKSFWMHLSF